MATILVLAACSNKNKSDEADLGNEGNKPSEVENQDKNNQSTSPSETVEGSKQEKKEQGEVKVRADYIEATKNQINELKNIQTVDTTNYKVIQEVHKKYENASKNDKDFKIEEVDKKYLENLVKEANQVEKQLESESTQSVASFFLETANGLQAVKGEGIVKKDLAFDRVEVKLNDKSYDATINGQVFELSRKLIVSEVKEAKVFIYAKDQVVEEITVEVLPL